jgi:hypothetical protein
MIKNVIKWGKKQLIEGSVKQSSWYDTSEYKVPYTGTFDYKRIWEALYQRFPQRFTRFGGYTTVSEITDLGEGFMKIQLCYHIGD